MSDVPYHQLTEEELAELTNSILDLILDTPSLKNPADPQHLNANAAVQALACCIGYLVTMAFGNALPAFEQGNVRDTIVKALHAGEEAAHAHRKEMTRQ